MGDAEELNKDKKMTDDPTDGRKKYEWVDYYPPEAQKQIHFERFFLIVFFVLSIIFIFATWRGWICSLLYLIGPISPDEAANFKKYSYYASSGMLGGVVFGMKYFYRVVARGFWHLQRREWRFLSPCIAMAIAVVVGWMLDASLMKNHALITSASVLSIGFLSGYFADEAVAKMYEIANAIFGRSHR